MLVVGQTYKVRPNRKEGVEKNVLSVYHTSIHINYVTVEELGDFLSCRLSFKENKDDPKEKWVIKDMMNPLWVNDCFYLETDVEEEPDSNLLSRVIE